MLIYFQIMAQTVALKQVKVKDLAQYLQTNGIY